MQKKKVLFGPFVGELGWELLFWQGWVRKLCHEEFRGYHKIAVSRLGHHVFYDSCDEFIPIMDEMFPKDYSARGYISDFWQDGLPSNTERYRWSLPQTLSQLMQGVRPHKILVEYPSSKPPTSKIFENYLKVLVSDYGGETIFIVPWKMNNVSGTQVGFEIPKNSKLMGHNANTRTPSFENQLLQKIQGSHKISADHLSNDVELVAVLPRSRSYRREDKNWSEKNYLNLIDGIASRGKRVVLIGSPGGAYFSDYTPDGCINLINEPSDSRLSTQLAHLERCQFALGAMSGAMLLALASGCPSIIFGELSQMHRYYYENFMKTKMNYVADLHPRPEELLTIVDSF